MSADWLIVLQGALTSAVAMGAPLYLAALGELFAERAGVLNIGIEGMVLMGAFAAAIACYRSGNPWLGLAAGMAAAGALALLFAILCVRWGADQVVVGMGMNLLSFGLTGVFYRALFGFTGAAFTVQTFAPVPLPVLRHLPLVGPALFESNVLVYLAALLCPLSAWFLFHTRPGLNIRAVGEHPLAADAAGVSVQRVRLVAALFGGLMAGAAGAYLSVAHSFNFTPGMSAGRGFIALAIVIFGRWHPAGALLAALLFGAAEGLQFHLQALSVHAPYQAWLMLPYALTVLALALRGRAVQGPAALARPYPEHL